MVRLRLDGHTVYAYCCKLFKAARGERSSTSELVRACEARLSASMRYPYPTGALHLARCHGTGDRKACAVHMELEKKRVLSVQQLAVLPWRSRWMDVTTKAAQGTVVD